MHCLPHSRPEVPASWRSPPTCPPLLCSSFLSQPLHPRRPRVVTSMCKPKPTQASPPAADLVVSRQLMPVDHLVLPVHHLSCPGLADSPQAPIVLAHSSPATSSFRGHACHPPQPCDCVEQQDVSFSAHVVCAADQQNCSSLVGFAEVSQAPLGISDAAGLERSHSRSFCN